MIPLFTVALFVSAWLLFMVQPMFAKMILPVLGGGPSVWNTCVLFFETALFTGYLYAHVTARWIGARRQAAMHLGVMLIPLAVLPVTVSARWGAPSLDTPAQWLLGRMLASVGLPFFVVAATAPLLQHWFASTKHRDAADPYFLYTASNLGSMAALLAYPLMVEPWLRLRVQSLAWAYGYGVLIVLITGCAVALWRAPENTTKEQTAGDDHVTWTRRIAWLAFAAVPSSLMLSVATYISTDIAAIPLLWIVPLLLYLLTFVLAFARRPIIAPSLTTLMVPAVVLPAVFAFVTNSSSPLWLFISLHLAVFFLTSLVCHQELARRRPGARDLTDFYLWMSLGGVVGGVFNTLVAPNVFVSAAEYPIGLVAACLLRPARSPGQRPSKTDLMFPAAIGLSALLLANWAPLLNAAYPSLPSQALVFGIPLVAAAMLWRSRLPFALSLGAILLAATFLNSRENQVVYAGRNFFGITRVIMDEGLNFRLLVDGRTLHGIQAVNPARAREPMSYYNPDGPVGQLFASFGASHAKQRIAAVGLGTGSLACYASQGQQWTFYEINPAAVPLAKDGAYFTFIRNCLPSVRIVLGDARLTLAREHGEFDLIILDAFSSDAIPVHLMTREAFGVYLRRLAPGGVLFAHITNRSLDLSPVIGNLAADAKLEAIVQRYKPTSVELARGGLPSIWVAMARRAEDLGTLPDDRRWSRLTGNPSASLWSDDFSNIVSVLKWRN